jgi:hypothetical protein
MVPIFSWHLPWSCSLYKNPQSYPVLPLMPSTHRADLLQRVRQAYFALFLQGLAVFLKHEWDSWREINRLETVTFVQISDKSNARHVVSQRISAFLRLCNLQAREHRPPTSGTFKILLSSHHTRNRLLPRAHKLLQDKNPRPLLPAKRSSKVAPAQWTVPTPRPATSRAGAPGQTLI